MDGRAWPGHDAGSGPTTEVEFKKIPQPHETF